MYNGSSSSFAKAPANNPVPIDNASGDNNAPNKPPCLCVVPGVRIGLPSGPIVTSFPKTTFLAPSLTESGILSNMLPKNPLTFLPPPISVPFIPN